MVHFVAINSFTIERALSAGYWTSLPQFLYTLAFSLYDSV